MPQIITITMGHRSFVAQWSRFLSRSPYLWPFTLYPPQRNRPQLWMSKDSLSQKQAVISLVALPERKWSKQSSTKSIESNREELTTDERILQFLRCIRNPYSRVRSKQCEATSDDGSFSLLAAFFVRDRDRRRRSFSFQAGTICSS
jgi:hypothetical protein